METNSLFYYLSQVSPVHVSKVNIISLNDKYSYPPFFRFKFQGIDKNNERYSRLETIVQEFKGNLKWSLITNSETENFILIPQIFVSDLGNDFYKTDKYIKENSFVDYKRNIDYAIEDIPKLGDYIVLKFNKKDE
jgi:hypothetical protein